MTYRSLAYEEWWKLRGRIPDDNIPHPDTARAVVCEDDDGDIVAVLLAQTAIHTEPIWVREDYRGRCYLPLMFKKLLTQLPRGPLWTFLEGSKLTKLARRMGFETTPYSVMFRR